jgi:hypothetical protein
LLESAASGAVLSLYNAAGGALLSLYNDASGALLSLYNAAGRALLSYDAASGALLSLYNEHAHHAEGDLVVRGGLKACQQGQPLQFGTCTPYNVL